MIEQNAKKETAHCLSLLVANRPGVLVRIALVFSRRGYNLDSLVVSPTLNPDFSRMNIVAHGNPEILVQIIKQLEKLVDVIQAKDHTGSKTVEKELALIKVKCRAEQRTEILQYCDHFKATTVDMTESSMIIQITGNTDKIDAMKHLLDKFEVLEYIRTGKVIMLQGEAIT
ncbi:MULTISPECIES: acetolactate synthase small subunit [Fibrobacter]|uniref:Acetolactate synthase small subunit n=1 Tax=Fibrobacter intestinalis TaxID=28122 RepID=A0A1M6YGN0_9BACT|nr:MULTISPECIES: acetolactate synthase small subunit [Fibrobacter]MDD7299590.1 acetolactate synthase small subunit [Fibrobacter intestinalis]PBC67095.1 acetolactate synthase small subunit [Fibrobacter sp. UWS1]PBC72873.1 acetolactate synthase small subunit [Fibrobacter sp. NR9]SHL17149.1 acetolactate synthase, small subunit [Fibrobacter intestinalis]SJZ44011.1 acetolactate synthase, small subunit [Fibrobacter intestinalis]